jgi:hypothetical protein
MTSGEGPLNPPILQPKGCDYVILQKYTGGTDDNRSKINAARASCSKGLG